MGAIKEYIQRSSDFRLDKFLNELIYEIKCIFGRYIYFIGYDSL